MVAMFGQQCDIRSSGRTCLSNAQTDWTISGGRCGVCLVVHGQGTARLEGGGGRGIAKDPEIHLDVRLGRNGAVLTQQVEGATLTVFHQ